MRLWITCSMFWNIFRLHVFCLMYVGSCALPTQSNLLKNTYITRSAKSQVTLLQSLQIQKTDSYQRLSSDTLYINMPCAVGTLLVNTSSYGKLWLRFHTKICLIPLIYPFLIETKNAKIYWVIWLYNRVYRLVKPCPKILFYSVIRKWNTGIKIMFKFKVA